MASDFDPLTSPAVMPRSVRRTNPDGTPTQFMLDWEQAFKGWTTSQVVHFNEQVNELTDEFNGISANGQVQFKVIATPIGAIAAYGIFLQAGSSFTGMSLIANSDGTSSISFAASSFKLNDSGTATNVFNYSGGVFTFNVPVVINNGELQNNSVTRAWTNSGGVSTSVPMTFRGTGFIEVYAQFMGDAAVYTAIDQFVLRVYEDGIPIGDTPISQDQNGTGITSASRYGATVITYIRVPSAGNHTYSAELVKTVAATGLSLSGVLVIVKEYSK